MTQSLAITLKEILKILNFEKRSKYKLKIRFKRNDLNVLIFFDDFYEY
jgi:hypothetical protein